MIVQHSAYARDLRRDARRVGVVQLCVVWRKANLFKTFRIGLFVKRSTGHTHTPTDNNTPDTDTHAHDKQHP